MIALDTNIWIYTHDSRDPVKQAQAIALISSSKSNLALPWQVGSEFIHASRKLQAQGFSTQDAWDSLRDMRSIATAILIPTNAAWDHAESIIHRFGISFWDALLAAACIEGGANTLYSEDFGNLNAIDSLAIVHPF